MRKIVFGLMLFLAFYNADAQNIGTKKSLKPYKTYLKSPDFLELLEKSKQLRKDSTEILIFNGFSYEKFLECSFDSYKFKKKIYEDEFGKYEYLDSVSSIHYIYQNQKIIYKEVWLKKGTKRETIEIYYYKNEQPRKAYLCSEEVKNKKTKIYWYFDKKGNIINETDYYAILEEEEKKEEEKKKFVLDNSKFTFEEHKKIRKHLSKMIANTDIGGKGLDYFSVSDWKLQNKVKKYLKKLFKTDLDLYIDGINDDSIVLFSEYFGWYELTYYWKEYEEMKRKYNKPRDIEKNKK